VVALKFVFGDHEYVVAPLAVNVVELPEHMVGGADKVTVGVGLTVTTTVFEAPAHPPVVPVTVYVVVVVGLALTLAPVVALKFVLGAHVYVVAPLAVKVVELPEHIVAGPDTVTVGVGLIDTETVPAEPGQPLIEATTE